MQDLGWLWVFVPSLWDVMPSGYAEQLAPGAAASLKLLSVTPEAP